MEAAWARMEAASGWKRPRAARPERDRTTARGGVEFAEFASSATPQLRNSGVLSVYLGQ